jgi:hypothetical protein
VTNEHCQPADHTTFTTNNDAAANSLALELYSCRKPEASFVGYDNASTEFFTHLTKRSDTYYVGNGVEPVSILRILPSRFVATYITASRVPFGKVIMKCVTRISSFS